MNELINFLACSSENCHCWIIVLLNIVSVLYLVFCSFFSLNRFLRMFGWIWISLLTVSTVGIVFAHTCIYTLLCTIFTMMMICAILAVILPQKDAASNPADSRRYVNHNGSYVISRTDEHIYTFCLYDTKAVKLASSAECFGSLAAAKAAIKLCRNANAFAKIEDDTAEWIRDEEHPKYVIDGSENNYFFRLMADKNSVIIKSDSLVAVKSCIKLAERTQLAAGTVDVYLTFKPTDEPPMTFVQAEETEAIETETAPEPTLEMVTAEEVSSLMSDTEALKSLIDNTNNAERVIKCKYEIINIDTLSRNFENGDTVNLTVLKARKLVSEKAPHIKVLARGMLDKKLMVYANQFSLDAVKMITILGGKAIRTNCD